MAVTQDMLVSELQQLLRLTAFEQTLAQVRRSQAASAVVATELAANAAKARERQRLLTEAVRQSGGIPDVVGAALGRAGALVQTQLNQAQTLQGSLLGDLALAHQLRERARYARTLAETLDTAHTLPVLDRVEAAATALIEWLEQRLTEAGRTGTSALRATPVQQLVQTARAALGLPLGILAAGLNQASSLLRGALPPQDTEPEQVIDLTGVDDVHEPFPAYSRLTGDSVMRHVADSGDVDRLREVLAYEQAHRDRKGVVQAAQERLRELNER